MTATAAPRVSLFLFTGVFGQLFPKQEEGSVQGWQHWPDVGPEMPVGSTTAKGGVDVKSGGQCSPSVGAATVGKGRHTSANTL